MAKRWRWIDDEDGTHTLVEGDELMPLPRVILRCGDISAEHQAVIAAAPDLVAACQAVAARLDYLSNLWGQEGVTRTLQDQLRAAIAKARGEVPDA